MALLLGPVLYAHIFQRGNPAAGTDLGPIAAQTFWRAFAVDAKSSSVASASK